MRPESPALLVGITIATAAFAISFALVADADRSSPATAARTPPRHEPALPDVALGPAASLRVRTSLLARPARPAPVRRVRQPIAPAPAPAALLPSAPATGVPAQPVTQPAPVTVAPPPPRPAPKPLPQPAAKPEGPKPPDFDDTGPPAPGKGRAAGR